ncbi:hypothetical protein CEUSTIGMA_g858.t1 [Chlamydomonas eustigma]|uniref:Tubulin--tyrosine ligase-like protein 5 n=1 Tax=Chlamydomonas eustigma TaxID=1157962 RepID=A0A250WRS3_9CHLO|nr:hypothetical protein CEUSTIGMA_g858.t1 [Chlamydomonas eustigma]|eukprot:GAX73406.1 hypothetical protein CEUSTIGMA_g858.t1 [Chlamydomonas eustigma]
MNLSSEHVALIARERLEPSAGHALKPQANSNRQSSSANTSGNSKDSGENVSCKKVLQKLIKTVGPPTDRPKTCWGSRLDGALDHSMKCASAISLPTSLPTPEPSFRFWIDECLWSRGKEAVQLLEAVLREAGGSRTGGPSRGSFTTDKNKLLGSSHCGQWELLWSKSTYALQAARALRHGQAISAIVGLNSLTMKKRMQQTLKACYGQEAFSWMTPLTFSLPEELPEWQAWVTEHPEHCEGGMWMLKTGQDAGRGLRLLNTKEALQVARREAAVQPYEDGGAEGLPNLTLSSSPEMTHLKNSHRLKVAQIYIDRPLLLEGRKSHLRLWVLVTCGSPPVAYLYRRGLVLFSSEPYNAQSTHIMMQQPYISKSRVDCSANATAGPDVPTQLVLEIDPGHVTNLARNSSGWVWNLEQFRDCVNKRGAHEACQGDRSPSSSGRDASVKSVNIGDCSARSLSSYDAIWAKIVKCCTAALKAASGPLQAAHNWLRPGVDQYGYQLMGVDFMLDQDLQPWLLEFNSSPSIMTHHDDETTQKLIYEEKVAMLRDMVSILMPRLHRPGKVGGGRNSAKSDNNQDRGGFVALPLR